MPKIIIIGNSAAGFSCCDTLVKNPTEKEITVISAEDYSAYNRNLLLGYLAGSIGEDELFLCPDDYYEKNKVRFLKNSKVALVETKKQRLTLKDNTKINYDYLVIASGSKPVLPDIAGNSKEGVFIFYALEEIKEIKQRLMLADTVAIVGEPMVCVELAGVPLLRDKEVKIIAKTRPDSFSPSGKQEWIEGLEVNEIIGEGAQMQAIKLTNGKVIGMPLVIFAGAHLPASEFLKGSDIETRDGCVIVNDLMRTSIENVFACGSVASAKTWDDAIKEGITAAESLIKQTKGENNLCQQTS